MMASGFIQPDSYLLLVLSVIILSTGVYALRGVYFALLHESKIPIAVSGTAIGIISVVGYTPDIFMGPLMGYLIDSNPGATGHQYLFWVLAVFSTIGLISTFQFKKAVEHSS